ncbi:MAG TPA: putative ABC transporter permease [Propionibacteriaceae bacterium]
MESLYSTSVLGLSVYLILWLFFVYCFLGVLIEGVFGLVTDRTVELRLGLLYLPLRPIYGLGGVVSTLLAQPFLQQPVVVFVIGVLVCSVVEFVASWFTESVFGTVSWDYSDKVWNVQGRICLQYSVCWGVLALVAVYVLDRLLGVTQPAPRQPGETVLTVLVALALLSIVLTLAALARVRERVDALRAEARGEPVSVSDRPWAHLVGRLAPDPVLISSFPRMGLMAELKALTGGQQSIVVHDLR